MNCGKLLAGRLLGGPVAAGVLLCASIVSPHTLAAPLADNMRISNNAAEIRAPLGAWLNTQVQALAGNDNNARSTARTELVEAIGGAPTTPVFLDEFARQLNDLLMPLASNQAMNVRLNTAIVAARVAEHWPTNGRLAPVTSALLKDQAEGVLLWSLRAARAMLPELVKTAPKPPLLAQVVMVGDQHSTSGLLMQEVYSALSLRATEPNIHLPNTAVPSVLPDVQRLMQKRVSSFNPDPASGPGAEEEAARFLTARPVWEAQNPVQRQQTAQMLLDLMAQVAPKLKDTSGVQKDRLLGLFRTVAKSVQVIGLNANNQPLQDSANAAAAARADTDNFEKFIAPIATALEKVVPGVKAPSANPGAGADGGASTAGSSTPASGTATSAKQP